MPNFERDLKLRTLAAVYGTLLAVPAALLVPFYGKVGFLCLVLNMAAAYFIVKAKIQFIKRTREFKTFGPAKMLNHEKRRYLFGYFLLLISVGLIAWQILTR